MKVLSDVGREGVTRILTAKQRTKERVTTAERNLSTASKLPTRNIKERPRDNPQRKRGRRQEKANEVKSVNCLSLLVWYFEGAVPASFITPTHSSKTGVLPSGFVLLTYCVVHFVALDEGGTTAFRGMSI
jgi:hypothetical protein